MWINGALRILVQFPPEAKVGGSNPLGRTIYLQNFILYSYYPLFFSNPVFVFVRYPILLAGINEGTKDEDEK